MHVYTTYRCVTIMQQQPLNTVTVQHNHCYVKRGEGGSVTYILDFICVLLVILIYIIIM